MKLLEQFFMPALLLGLMAPQTAPSPQTAPPPAPHVQCNLVYRPSLTLSYRPETTASVRVSRDRNPEKTQLGDFEFLALYHSESGEPHAVQLIVTPIVRPGVNNLPSASQVYYLDRNQLPRNQFAKGHGFTGLNSITHPKSTSTLDYFCVSKR